MSREQAIQDLISCFKEFDCFPFDPVYEPYSQLFQPHLKTSRRPSRMGKAKQDGEAQLKIFMDEQICSKEKSIHDRIKRNSHLTFGEIPLWKVSGAALKMKQGEMESRALASVVNLVDASGLLSLPELMNKNLHRSMPIVATFRKTQKSKLLQKLILQPLDVNSYTALTDMGMHDLASSISYSRG